MKQKNLSEFYFFPSLTVICQSELVGSSGTKGVASDTEATEASSGAQPATDSTTLDPRGTQTAKGSLSEGSALSTQDCNKAPPVGLLFRSLELVECRQQRTRQELLDKWQNAHLATQQHLGLTSQEENSLGSLTSHSCKANINKEAEEGANMEATRHVTIISMTTALAPAFSDNS